MKRSSFLLLGSLYTPGKCEYRTIRANGDIGTTVVTILGVRIDFSMNTNI
jgi:hypothetical protein